MITWKLLQWILQHLQKLVPIVSFGAVVGSSPRSTREPRFATRADPPTASPALAFAARVQSEPGREATGGVSRRSEGGAREDREQSKVAGR